MHAYGHRVRVRACCLVLRHVAAAHVGPSQNPAGLCLDMCANMCVDMYVNMCMDMCVDMCIDMCIDVCMDMCIDM